jgi:2-oxoisovalerate dehydrogenase E2 component (dihydrolipoyl transacylase)
MTAFQMKLPDVGEGVAEAEIVEWLVAVGDAVTPDSVLAEVLTDKATVEVACPVTGVVTALHGEPGDVRAVGSELVDIETDDQAPAPDGGSNDAGDDEADTHQADTDQADTDQPDTDQADTAQPDTDQADTATDAPRVEASPPDPPPTSGASGTRPTAAPAVRARASSLGIDLAVVSGTGPAGRVLHADLDRMLAGGSTQGAHPPASDEGRPQPIRGVRRRIADRLSAAWTEIPHITYVDAIDVTELERLRRELNRSSDEHDDEHDGVRLTLLPFLARAISIACGEQPHLNAHYDHAAETLTTFDAVHVGIATQTDAGLLVPVVRNVESREIWDVATEVGRVTAAARDGNATRDELSGSTITITSLGALGGLVTTPIINAPEVAIVGVNKMEMRPVWRSGSFEPRQMFNLSSSFDHRMVDGWDAATFMQRIKALLETPALLFVDGP